MATAIPVPPGGSTGTRQARGLPQPVPPLPPSQLIAPVGATVYRQGVGTAITGTGSLCGQGKARQPGDNLAGGVSFTNPPSHRPVRIIRHAGPGSPTSGLGVLVAAGQRVAAGEGAPLTASAAADATGISLRHGHARIAGFGSTHATGYRDHLAEARHRLRHDDELLLLVDV